MAERVRTDLGFKPLYASLSFSEINTAVVYDTSTQQLFFGALTGSEGSYDIDFAALNIFASGNIFAAGAITASQGFSGEFFIDEPDETILFADVGGTGTTIGGKTTFTFNKSDDSPEVTIKSNINAGNRARLFITGVNESSIDLHSAIPKITFRDTATVGDYSSSVLQQTGSIFKIYSEEGQGNNIIINPLSGSISASGHLFASLSFSGSGIGVVTYDSESGQFFITGSPTPIDTTDKQILFNEVGKITGSRGFTFDKGGIAPYSHSMKLGRDGNTLLHISGTQAPKIKLTGKIPKIHFEAEDPDNPGTQRNFMIDIAESPEISSPQYIRFSSATSGFAGIHFDADNQKRIYANNLTLIGGGFSPGATAVQTAMSGGLICVHISASGIVTGSRFEGFENLNDPTQAQFIGTASWALNASASSKINIATASSDFRYPIVLSSGQFSGTNFLRSAFYHTGDPSPAPIDIWYNPTDLIFFVTGTLNAYTVSASNDAQATFFNANSNNGYSINNGPVLTQITSPFSGIQVGSSLVPLNLEGTGIHTDNPFTASIISASGDITASGGHFDNNVTILGTASINYLHTIYESSSIIYSSGSTKFGDTLDDTHQRTGSMFISGGILSIPDGAITASIISASSTPGVNLIGTASFATSSVSASFAEFASSASYASASTSASFATSASHAEFASSSSYASASTSASFATSASHAITASYSRKIETVQGSSDYAYTVPFEGGEKLFRDLLFTFNPSKNLLASPNIIATAITSSVVSASTGISASTNYDSGTDTRAVLVIDTTNGLITHTGSYGGFVTSASFATSASHAEFASSASYASASTSASFATSASHAEFASSASYASASTSASFATSASHAEFASSASYASMSLQQVTEIGSITSIPITASIISASTEIMAGNISSSGYISASGLQYDPNGDTSVFIGGPITASGDISSSGNIYVDTSYDDGTAVRAALVIDTTTGLITHTGSYGSGGGSGDPQNLQQVTTVGAITSASISASVISASGDVFVQNLTINSNTSASGGTLTINRNGTTNIAAIEFPTKNAATYNDPGFIRHHENQDKATMSFCVSDNANSTVDQFYFGSTAQLRALTIDTRGVVSSSFNGTSFIGTASHAISASHSMTASRVAINDASNDSNYSIPLIFPNANPSPLYDDTDNGLLYNPSTNKFTVQGTVNVQSSVSASAVSASIITASSAFIDDGTISGSLHILGNGSTIGGTIAYGPEDQVGTGNKPMGEVIYYGSSDGALEANKIYKLHSDGKWKLTDADSEISSSGLIGVSLGTSVDNGFLLKGLVKIIAPTNSPTGSTQYLSTTNGRCTPTPTSASGDVVRGIGYTIDGGRQIIYFNPDSTYIVAG